MNVIGYASMEEAILKAVELRRMYLEMSRTRVI